jgi:hypothetical protein
MKTYALPHAVLVASLLAFAPSLLADDKPATKASEKKAEGKLSEEEMTKRWMEAATPGAPHKVLDVFVGEWEVASKWWMDPAEPPMESKGTVTKKWILDGRFLQEDFSGEMMGMPFKGTGMTGYDNIKKQYNSFWVDSSTTAMINSLGTASKDGKTLTFNTRMDDCMTGEKDKPVRFVIKVEGKDKHIFEFYETSGGKEKKSGEMTYTRKS